MLAGRHVPPRRPARAVLQPVLRRGTVARKTRRRGTLPLVARYGLDGAQVQFTQWLELLGSTTLPWYQGYNSQGLTPILAAPLEGLGLSAQSVLLLAEVAALITVALLTWRASSGAPLQTLAVMVETDKPLSELASIMRRYPQVLVNVKVAQRKPLSDLPDVQALIAKVEAALGDEGRVLVRYSGTEAKVRVMVEGPEESRIQGYADEIAKALQTACG
mgnify:CR=1 FL=1